MRKQLNMAALEMQQFCLEFFTKPLDMWHGYLTVKHEIKKYHLTNQRNYET